MSNIRRAPLWASVRAWAAVVAAVAAAAGGWAYIAPRWAARAPRLDEKAYNEALAMLKEEVGAAAVDKGVFLISPWKVQPPYSGRLSVGFDSPSGSCYALVSCAPGRSRIIYAFAKPPSAGRPAKEAVAVADIDVETARRIWDTVIYLRAIAARDSFSIDPHDFRRWGAPSAVVNSTWPSVTRKALVDVSRGMNLNELVRDMCLVRYLRDLAARPDIVYYASPGGTLPAFLDYLQSLLPLRTFEDEALLSWSVAHAGLLGDERSLPLLKDIERREAARLKRKERTWTAAVRDRIPVLRRKDREYPGVGEAIWLFETLAGRDDAGRVKALADEALGVPDGAHAAIAREFLSQSWPDEWRKLVLDKFASFPEPLRYKTAVGNERLFSDQAGGLAALARDPSPRISARGYLYLYSLTDDPAAFAKLEQLAFAPDPVDPAQAAAVDAGRDEAQEWLSAVYAWKHDGGDVVGAFREHMGRIAPRWMAKTLAAGGESEVGFLLDLVTAPIQPPPGVSGEYMRALSEAAWPALYNSGNPIVAKAILDRLPPSADKLPPSAMDSVIPTAGADSLERLQKMLEWLESPQGSNVPDRGNFVTRVRQAALKVRLDAAEDPVAFLAGLDNEGLELASPWLMRALTSRADDDKLRAALAEGNEGRLYQHLYPAIVLRERSRDAFAAR